MSTGTIESTKQEELRQTYSDDDQQFLTFYLADEYYGVDVLKVQEIKGYTAVIWIPNMPDYLKGVLSLRGTIVPIVDLRMKFGMSTIDPTPFTVIVVVNVRNRVMGLIVDAVSDVLDLRAKDIQPAPELGKKCETTFVAGIGNFNDHLITLLDIDQVLSDEEVKAVEEIPADVEPAVVFA